MSRPILCVDFDGVIHQYTSPWEGEAVIKDPPVPGALEWLEQALEHFCVQIYSSRSKSQAGRTAMRVWIKAHGGEKLGKERAQALESALVFATEKPAAFLTIDDRAIRFDGHFEALDPKRLLKFKPWNKK